MTELERVDNSENFNFRGSHRFCTCKSARSAPRQREKKIGCLHSDGSATYLYYSKSLGVRLPACNVIKNKVLMLIKVFVVYV